MKEAFEFLKDVFSYWTDEAVTFLEDLLEKDISKRDNHDLDSSFNDDPKSFMSRKGHGFSMTGDKYLNTIEQNFTHTICISPSGGGKSSTAIIPTCLNDPAATLVISENSGEIFEKTAAYLESQHSIIVDINLGAKEYSTDTYFVNPMHGMEPNTSDSAYLGSLLNKNLGDKKDFWKVKGEFITVLAIDTVLEMQPIYRNLANVQYLLESMLHSEDQVSVLVQGKSESVQRRWKMFTSDEPNVKSSVLSTALGALSFISNNPKLAFLTSRNNVPSLEKMRKNHYAIYLRVPVADAEIAGTVTDLIYGQMFRRIMSSPIPKEDDLPILFAYDELGSSCILGLDFYFANLRKWSCGILGCIQSEAMLEDMYGKAKATSILNNCNKVYYPGLTHESEKVSRLLGSYSYGEGEGEGEGEKTYTKTRSLMTPTEIFTMPKDQVLIVPNGGLKPILAKTKRYYEQKKLMKRVNIVVENNKPKPEPIEMHIEYFTLPEAPQPKNQSTTENPFPGIPHKDSAEIQAILNPTSN